MIRHNLQKPTFKPEIITIDIILKVYEDKSSSTTRWHKKQSFIQNHSIIAHFATILSQADNFNNNTSALKL